MKNRSALLLFLILLIPAVLAAATFTVTNANDSGPGSLRQAILDANAAAGADNISFAIPGAGVQTITLSTPLPQVSGQTVIDGYTQPGSSANSLTVGNNAVILIEINGNGTAGNGVLDIRGGNSIVRGLVVNRGNTAGISLGSDNNTLEGCFIGTDPTGTIDRGNASDGVFIANYFATGNGNHIGGPTPAARNVISGNGRRGMTFDQTSNGTVENNYIGTNAAGTGALGNDDAGIVMWVTSGHRIGGPTAGSRNVISGNATDGIVVQAPSNTIQNNFIGTNATGSAGLGNGANGIYLVSGTAFGIVHHSDNNVVGGVGAGNVISGNGNAGVYLQNAGFAPDGNSIRGNRIGTTADGTAALANNHGIWLGTPTNTVIGGSIAGEGNLVSGNRYHGILVTGSNTAIQGNKIGTDLSGTASLPNGAAYIGFYYAGIFMDVPCSGTTIGGASASARNIISGNKGDGIAMWGAVNQVSILGNYIGVQSDGISPLGNFADAGQLDAAAGISLRNYPANITIGGLGAGESNTIANNHTEGVVVYSGSGVSVLGNVVHHNNIGTYTFNSNTFPPIRAGGMFIANQNAAVIKGNRVYENYGHGLVLYYSSNSVVGGIAANERNVLSANGAGPAPLGQGAHGLVLTGLSNSNTVLGNYIGTDETGLAAWPNSGDGVEVFSGPQNNLFEQNVISGNAWTGIAIFPNGGDETAGNILRGNFIGVGANGSTAVGNAGGTGVYFGPGAESNIVGGSGVGEGNTISYNGYVGIFLDGAVSFTTIQGNQIASNGQPNPPVNEIGTGVYIAGDAVDNVIGGQVAGSGNVITSNAGDGVRIVARTVNNDGVITQYIPTRNAIFGNSISANGGLGIDLGGEGVGNSTGVNGGQIAPVLNSAQLELGTIKGSLQGTPNTTYRAEFFSNIGGDLAEGQFFLGSAPIPTDALGNGSFTVALPGLAAGTYLTATSTDPSNNSSEFSGAVGVGELTKHYGDHFVVNTTLAGVPLHWRGGSATYHISSTVPTTADNFVDAIRQAFAAWALAPPASYTENTLVVPDYHVFAGNIDGVNNVVYVSPDNASLWPGSATSDAWTAATGGADPNVIALTRVRYNTLNGEITDADIAINAVNPLFQYSTDGTTLGFLDLQNVMTHEAGHFGGMGDIYNLGDAPYVVEMGSGNQDVAMYGIIKGSSVTGVVETKKRVIQNPDKAGISFIYGSLPPSGVDVVLLIDGSATFASSYDGFSPSVKGARNLVLNMRAGDRVGIVKLPNTTVLGLTPVSTGRDAVLAALSGLALGGTSGIGQGLQVASGLLTGATQSMNQRAMLLFSAGEETGAPGALTSGVLSTVQAAGAQVYTMGFSGSYGQALGANLAQFSGGGYYLASDPTAPGGIVTTDAMMINVVDQIWTRLSGFHLTYQASIPSSSFEYGNGFVSGQPGFVSGQPGFVTGQPGIITGQPGFVSGQPGFVSGQPGIVSGQPGFVSGQPGFVSGQPGFVSGQPAIVDDGTTIIVPAATIDGAAVPLGKVTATTAVGDSKVQLGLIVPGGAYPDPATAPPEIVDVTSGQIIISPYYLFYTWGVILPESIPFIKQRPSEFFSDISYVQGDKFAYYVVKNPKAGMWSLITAGDPENDLSAPVDVALTVTAISDVNMSVSFDRSVYQLSDQVTVSAVLKDGRGDGNQAVDEYGGGNPGGSTGGGPVTNATVQAVVTPPEGGSPETIPMTHVGGGVYTGSFSNTAVAGSYDFKVTATGVLIGLTEPYTREYQQSVHVSTPFSWNTVMLATNSAVIGEKADIHSGSIVVNNQRSSIPDPLLPELTIGEHASTPENYRVAASRVVILQGASVGGDVFYNSLTNNGTIIGATTTPLALPVVRTLPPFETATVGTNNITVATKKVTTITPGNYGDVVVQPQASLVFSNGGVYNFKSLWAKSKAKLVFNGPTHVRVLVAMRADNDTYVGPAQGTTFDPAGIIVYVGGTGSGSDFVSSVFAGPKASLFANFYAPNGTISLTNETELTGALFGRDIILGEKVQLTLATSFLGLRKEERTPWTLEPGDPAATAGLPTVFAMDQNYPNPFNPTTVITYQLPAQRAVTFTVYNTIGQEVVTLVNEVQPAGNYSVTWDGKNQAGYAVSTGVYIYKLQAGSFVDIKKMMLLK